MKEQWIERASQATPILYLDLDDTVRMGKTSQGRFVNSAADVTVFPNVPSILQAYKDKGWRIVAISNQGGVALHLLSADDAMGAVMETQKQCDGLFDLMSICTHHPDATDPEFAVCWCRKPRIGMLVEAALTLASRHNEYYPPHLALFVGDRPEDQQCADQANVRFMDAVEWRDGGWKSTVEATAYVTLLPYAALG